MELSSRGREENTKFATKLSAIFLQIFIPREELIDPEKTYNKMTVAELERLTGNTVIIFLELADRKFYRKWGNLTPKSDSYLPVDHFIQNKHPYK